MSDGNITIDRTRPRDWTSDPEEDSHRVSAGAASSGELHRLASDKLAGQRLADRLRDPPPDICTSYKHPLHHFDDCVTDPNPRAPGMTPRTSVLFFREEHDRADISPTDVAQRKLGDCAFMATLAGLAGSKEGQALIRNAITEHKDEKGEVVGYTVTLYARSKEDDPRTFAPQPIEISAREPYVHGHAEAAGDDTHDEIWPLIMEKAYAKLNHGYDAIAGGTSVQKAMEALLGHEVRSSGLDKMSDELLWSDLEQGKAVVLSSCHFFASNPYQLKTEHAYAVTGRLDRGGGDVVYRLYNPWNSEQPLLVPYKELATYFNFVDAGSTRGSQ
jgi:hypothetical protein